MHCSGRDFHDGTCFQAASWTAGWIAAIAVVLGSTASLAVAADDLEQAEAFLFTPPGFDQPGEPKTAAGDETGHLSITVRDATTGEPTFCRINVVGPDGHFYQPQNNYLTPFSLTGQWPENGKGNRQGKAPYRYFGRFFYSWGETEIDVPAGDVRVEVWKGFEHRPTSSTVTVEAGKTNSVEIELEHALPVAEKFGYYSGDPHIHITRTDDRDEQLILDLMQAEDIRFGLIMAYNEPAGPYSGVMQTMDMPQTRGLGRTSIRNRGDYSILSGQEYRSRTYGHLNLFMRDDLVLEGQDVNADNGPIYGHLGRETQQKGGYAFYAHGGYEQAIYADFVQGDVNGVELLQFGIYRELGLDNWYHILNIGYRFPIVGACDYPACRKLGDCKTYAYLPEGERDFPGWLAAADAGRSFVTTGPMLLLTVDGEHPGARVERAGAGPHRVDVKIRVNSVVAPVEKVQLLVGGRVHDEIDVPADRQRDHWFELERTIEIDDSSWIAARAFSTSPVDQPDAESHTNPVYVYLDGKAPYDRGSLDALLKKLDAQIDVHRNRDFPEKADVLAYFERSRDILLEIREEGGASSEGHPSDLLAGQSPSLDNPGARSHSDEQLAEFLKPVPPKSPAEALDTFETVDGFRMQLVAGEPLVYDPVAAAFDADGQLYVAEMRDYPYKPQDGAAPLGTVRLLRDIDDDGVFDEGHVFADELLWAAGIVPWQGGVFVAAPPDIWYLKDTDGDFRADVRRKVFEGFGTDNQQAMVNNLQWGIDNRVYGATAGNGGSIRKGGDKDDEESASVSVDGRDFRFDPRSRRFETVTGTIQFGNTFDDWGNRFVCSESRPLLHVVLPERYLARNPYLPVPAAILNIGGGPVPIHRISPIERWRHIRSSRRIAHGERNAGSAGASHHVVDAAAGVTVYRGHAYPGELYGDVFVGDAQNNLVHHRALEADGVTFQSERVEENTEFVRSSDNWFRPVNFINAPDGTLYVLDMSREILESIHIPDDVMKHLDLKHGRDYGRIYRIAPTDYRYPGAPRLSTASTAELVRMLAHPSAWGRETAQRLIYERQDQDAVEPLHAMLHGGDSPQTRLCALWSLDGLDALSDADILSALSDASTHLREHALRLAESRFDDNPRLLSRAIELADDDDTRVRFQTAFSLGESIAASATKALAAIARRDAADQWIRTAVLSSSATRAVELFRELVEDKAGRFVGRSEGRAFLHQLAVVAGGRGESDEVAELIELLATSRILAEQSGTSHQLLLALGSGLNQSGQTLPEPGSLSTAGAEFLSSALANAADTAENSAADEIQRVQAVELLGYFPFPSVQESLTAVLDPREPEAVQLAAVESLAGYAADNIAEMLLARWRKYTPAVRVTAIRTLLSREAWTIALLQAASKDEATAAQIDQTQRSLLASHRNSAVRRLADQLFDEKTTGGRADVIVKYRKALEIEADASRGAEVFRRDCMGCHRLGDEGYNLGPNLAASPAHDAEALLVHVLDPNRYVLPNYLQYVVVDRNGRSYTGMIAAQTATSITLKREKEETDTILRQNIEELVATGKSLMPEGLEKKITPQEMADVIAFLQASQSDTAGSEERPLDIGTLPGLIEPD